MISTFEKTQPLAFLSPINGDCVNARDGRMVGETLWVHVKVAAPAGSEVFVNRQRLTAADGVYEGAVPLTGRRTLLTAEDRTHGTGTEITVLHLPQAVGKYRISSDDNILFLKDLTAHREEYRSIFENPYLAVYKKAHDLYGAKVQLNLFYEFCPSEALFSSPDRSYFNLSMMTDRFKEEFRANADWLKLAFHARKEMPPAPYRNATAEEITRDCIAVCREIVRFAGAESLSDSTTVHFGEATREGVRALRALGLRSLTGYFEKHHGKPLVAYYTEGDLTDHIGARDFWYDAETDMFFGRIDRVLNLGSLSEIMEEVPRIAADPHRGGFVSLMIHEQYFYSDYSRYLADFEARVLEPCRYLFENGYLGAHISEAVEEPHFNENSAFFNGI